jgi:hypothetical protein
VSGCLGAAAVRGLTWSCGTTAACTRPGSTPLAREASQARPGQVGFAIRPKSTEDWPQGPQGGFGLIIPPLRRCQVAWLNTGSSALAPAQAAASGRSARERAPRPAGARCRLGGIGPREAAAMVINCGGPAPGHRGARARAGMARGTSRTHSDSATRGPGEKPHGAAQSPSRGRWVAGRHGRAPARGAVRPHAPRRAGRPQPVRVGV